MIYHKWSVVGFMLWLRYGVMSRSLRSLEEIYSRHLESPGTKAYSHSEAQAFHDFAYVDISTPLAHADLLDSPRGSDMVVLFYRLPALFGRVGSSDVCTLITG